jgi:hypothetical protein
LALRDSAAHRDPLDPLRRFISTPLRAHFRLGATCVMVQTNDSAFLSELPVVASPIELDAPIFEWKLVREDEVSGPLEEPLLLTSRTLTTVEMGPACLLGVDHQRRELFCFIGADIDARVFREVLFPFFCGVMNEVPDAVGRTHLQDDPQGTLNE